MRQGVANRKAERAQPKCVQEYIHLVAHAHQAVLEVAIIKAQTGIDHNLFHADANGQFDLPGEIVTHLGDGLRAQIEIAHLANIRTLQIANNYRRAVLGN